MKRPNLILEVERIERYVKLGMPEGVEPLAKDIPILLNRIAELETALMPFARAASQPNEGKPLIYVYHDACKNAATKLSKNAALAAQPKKKLEMPAEG